MPSVPVFPHRRSVHLAQKGFAKLFSYSNAMKVSRAGIPDGSGLRRVASGQFNFGSGRLKALNPAASDATSTWTRPLPILFVFHENWHNRRDLDRNLENLRLARRRECKAKLLGCR